MSELLKVMELPGSILKRISGDPAKTAGAIQLEYIYGHPKGITRKRTGKEFAYYLNNKRINDEKTLQRIKKLAIPPAWENVWICQLEQGHLQATGTDKRNRKQYIYHNLWSKMRNETKYFRLYEFGKALPAIRQQLEKDLTLPGLSMEKVLAMVVKIMEHTNIRVGNSFYEKHYGSFGITTLKDKHVSIGDSVTRFTFKGKKGVEHSISLKSRRLSRLIRKCVDVPGRELFQYYDKEGNHHSLDSGMVNNYIKEISGKNFSSKDFRTWEGTIHAMIAMCEISTLTPDNSLKRNEVEILNMVAKKLGNTRSVCKKYYIHPLILELYENDTIGKYLKELDAAEIPDNETGLLPVENVLMKILSSKSHAIKILE